jgi:radical SAM superfamily enzyme YgiQ (UPF0313 family)
MPKRFYPQRATELWLYDANNKITTLYSDKSLRLQDFSLNEVGSFIWTHCDGQYSNEDIAQKLFAGLEGEKPEIAELQAEVNEYLEELRNEELVYWKENIPDVLFIIPPFPDVYSKHSVSHPESSSPPLGVAYIAAVLKNNNIEVAILDMHIQALDIEDVIKHYREKQPKIVALSATTPTFPNAVKIANLLKAWNENVIIVIGGVHATCMPAESVGPDCIDFAVVGEGEYTMLDLTKFLIYHTGKIETISGIVYKDNGKIKINKPRERLSELDVLPFPARELLDIGAYQQKGAIVSSRGCPYHCNYCSCAVIAGHTYRVHSSDYVLDEIEFLIEKYNIRHFDFHDDTFNFYSKRVFEFCEKIKKRKLNFAWGCFCRVTNFNYEMALAMKKSGCKVIQFGVESGNQKVLNSINKRINITEIENAIISAQKAGIEKIACGFIIGHAEDTEETVNETINFGVKLSKLGVTDLAISVLTPYPGTDVYNNLGKNGINLLTKDWDKFIFSKVVIETKNLNKELLRELYVKGINAFREATIETKNHNFTKEILP